VVPSEENENNDTKILMFSSILL